MTFCSPGASASTPVPLPPPKAAVYLSATVAVVVPRFVRISSVEKFEPPAPLLERTIGTTKLDCETAPRAGIAAPADAAERTRAAAATNGLGSRRGDELFIAITFLAAPRSQ